MQRGLVVKHLAVSRPLLHPQPRSAPLSLHKKKKNPVLLWELLSFTLQLRIIIWITEQEMLRGEERNRGRSVGV